MLFRTDRAVALQAAPLLFATFDRYQLALAAVAIVASAMWRLTTPRAALTALFSLFVLAAIGTVTLAAIITPRMEALRSEGQSGSPEFMALHKRATTVYMAQAALLLAAGLLIPAAMASPRQKDPEAAEATAPPA
jgi:hypothetical protein